MNDKLVVSVLGNRHSGKSHTWNTLFGQTVKTGSYIRRLYLTSTEYIEVFLVSGSAEERHLYGGDIIGQQQPRIVLCSMQYLAGVTQTIEYFLQNGYSLYTHWLNPGYSDGGHQPDHLGLATQLLYRGAVLAIRDATTHASTRVQELKEFLYGWAKSRNLLLRPSGLTKRWGELRKRSESLILLMNSRYFVHPLGCPSMSRLGSPFHSR